jgi:hypothetical protein
MVETPRRLWEITGVDPGVGLTLRDTKTGDVVAVTERLGSQRPDAVGRLTLARVVAVGDEQQLIGMPVDVPLRLRDSAIELVDSDPDADALGAWYGGARVPPSLVNAEHEQLVLCTAELTTGHDVAELHAVLDAVLRVESVEDGSRWTELFTSSAGDDLVRGTVRYESGRLVVDANSVERFERLLATVTGAVDDAVIVSDERIDARQALRHRDTERLPEPDDELGAIAEQYVRQKEIEWIDESIPALGGMTPREALDDPTRREDLLALLRELDAQRLPDGASGFDANRIRGLLGIDS